MDTPDFDPGPNPGPNPGPGEAPHLLVVDDDTRLRDLLRRFLADQGFLVTVAADAAQARAHLAGMAFDLLVVDVMMPGEDGLSLVRSLRADGLAVPVLMLTALGEAEDRIRGLEHGADDYLAKPFEPRELSLRIRAILRRTPPPPAAPPPPEPPREVRLGRHTFDLARGELRQGGRRVHLTSAETALLTALARVPGTFLDREALARAANVMGGPRAVDVQVTRLRKKLEDDPRQPHYLHTVRGRGYVLRPGP